MEKLSEVYSGLWEKYDRADQDIRERPRDGLQAELTTAARAVIRFEHQHEIPRLKTLVADHGAAVAAVEAGTQKLARLEHSIANQRRYIVNRFAANDTTGDALDLLAWELSAQLGSTAIEESQARAVELESELRNFLKGKSGLADCLLVQQNQGWDKVTAESFDWLRREAAQAAGGAVAA